MPLDWLPELNANSLDAEQVSCRDSGAPAGIRFRVPPTSAFSLDAGTGAGRIQTIPPVAFMDFQSDLGMAS